MIMQSLVLVTKNYREFSRPTKPRTFFGPRIFFGIFFGLCWKKRRGLKKGFSSLGVVVGGSRSSIATVLSWGRQCCRTLCTRPYRSVTVGVVLVGLTACYLSMSPAKRSFFLQRMPLCMREVPTVEVTVAIQLVCNRIRRLSVSVLLLG